MNIDQDNIASVLSEAAEVFEAMEKEGRLRLVFLGGAAVPLYADTLTFDGFSATKDLDVVTSIVSDRDREFVENTLARHGLVRDRDSGMTSAGRALPFRWWFQMKIQVDILSTDFDWGGNHNRWFRLAWQGALRLTLPSGKAIWLAHPPSFIGAKLDAFRDRGVEDYYHAKDLRDILAVVRRRARLHDEILASDLGLRNFIASAFHELSRHRDFALVLAEVCNGDSESEALLRSRIGALIKQIW
ncbi:hypothetical protein [Verrucomicrobium spinosum]|uniref:hypothetical protein n=1 Tax=Verrucomicrobium spinosum TaxID=2736 RepID=UPI0001746839|nr:hypothetical protein [Verrucomicrobium spinosum]